MVYRGRVPDFDDLGFKQQERFRGRVWEDLSPEQRAGLLEEIGLDPGRAKELATPPLGELHYDQLADLWQIHSRRVLLNRVDLEAAERVLPRFEDLSEPERQRFLADY